nr:immunoglobulin light chain junction region [Macaca mulatta]MOV80652.1 immunoglobulin light chain junction region [Macaca mulatta]
CLQYKFYPFTF